jgi:hypothetical protein
MKLINTVIVFDRGEVAKTSEGWANAHTSYTKVIREMEHPPGAGEFKLHPYEEVDGEERRNGVTAIKEQFLTRMQGAKWTDEESLSLDAGIAAATKADPWLTYPTGEELNQALHASVGDLDFWIKSGDEKIGIEWETGNISSSHRSLNKLCLALIYGVLDICVLIVPSRDMYEHLTDRIGNWKELNPYLPLWRGAGTSVKRGMLAITIVEQDSLDESVPYIPRTNAGRSKQGKQRLAQKRLSK